MNGERWVRRFQVKRLKVAFHSPPARPLFHSPFFLSSSSPKFEIPYPISRIRALSRVFHFLCLALHSCNLELGIWSLAPSSVSCPPVFYPHRSILGIWSLEVGDWLCPRRGSLGASESVPLRKGDSPACGAGGALTISRNPILPFPHSPRNRRGALGEHALPPLTPPHSSFRPRPFRKRPHSAPPTPQCRGRLGGRARDA